MPYASQSATTPDCPEQWATKLSNITFEKYEGNSNGFRYQLWDSNYIAGWASANPQLAQKVESLGKDVFVTIKWNLENTNSTSTSDKFSREVFSPLRPLPSERDGGPIPEWKLRYAGISNGSAISFSISIEQKGCTKKELSTDSFTFKELGLPTISIDEYFKLSKEMGVNFKDYKDFNFKQEDYIRNYLSGLKTYGSSFTGQDFDKERYIDIVSYPELFPEGFINWGLLPADNSNCVEGFNNSSFPQFPPKVIKVYSMPCKALVYLPIKAFELLKCVTANCASNQDLIDLTKKYPYLSQIYGDYGINRVPVMEVVIDYRKEYRKVLEAEIKFKQEAEARVAADKAAAEVKAAAELRAKQEAEAKAAAELRAKQEAEAKAAAELRAAGEKIISDAKAEAARILAAAKAAAAKKKTTITCIKGKLTKKVTAVKPVCPAGYKKKA